MTGELFSAAAFCIAGALLALVLRQYRPEYALLVSLGCSAAVALYAALGIGEVMEELEGVLSGSGIPPEMTGVVLKCLGICLLTELAGQTCRDAGENAIASKLELAGKVTLVLVSLPLFSRLAEVASTLLGAA